MRRPWSASLKPMKRVAACWLMLVACAQAPEGAVVQESSPSSMPASSRGNDPDSATTAIRDPHSFARPEEAAIRHLQLDLDVDFEARRLSGTAALDLDRHSSATEVVLDTWGLEVDEVRDGSGAPARFELGSDQGLLGRPLHITLGPQTDRVVVRYRTSPEATALQWLEPRQTAGGKQPFLFTQSQAIHARSWIPLQDTPGVRFTYDATIRVPPALRRGDERREPRQRDAGRAPTASACRSRSRRT